MDIERIIDGVADEVKKESIKENTKGGSDSIEDILVIPENELYRYFGGVDLKDEDIRTLIYKRFLKDTKDYINEFLKTSEDVNADKGMYKCSLETWKACVSYIGIEYFKTNKLVMDYKREHAEGGRRLNDDLIEIGLTVYEEHCNLYRKQFFIYDSCKFLGISLDKMYMLSDLHGRYLKKAHTIQEDSMRTALASGRSNVTAMAILLNHDYDYTRTTQVIHSNDTKSLCAENLPRLAQNQDVVADEGQNLKPNKSEDL